MRATQFIKGVAEGKKNDDNEPFNYDEWKASTVKPRKPRGWRDAEALGKALDREQSELRKRKEQGMAEGQLNEYLVRAGMPVKDVLALNLFQDFDPVEGAAAQFAEFAEEPMWQQVVRKYAPIANMLKKKLLAQKRPLTDAEAEAVEQTWYDGSDAYDDVEIEYLVDIYDQQIDILEALLAGNLTDEEFMEQGVAEGYFDDEDDDEPPYHVRILDRQTKKVIADEEIGDWENAAVDRAEAYLAWAKTKGKDIVAQVYQPAYGKNSVTWQVPEGNYDLKEQGVAEGHQSAKTIEQIKFWYKDAADAVEMAKAAEALNVNGMYDEAIKKYKHQAQISLSKANSLKQGVAEGNQEEKIGGRYDADDFDSMVSRLKKLAGAGPMKTVYDPDRRVYRNMPTAVQPKQQDKK